MYAVNHAAAALLIKRRYPSAPMLALLVGAQALEVLWVVLHYLGVERISLEGGVVKLGNLAWSHSLVSSVLVALLTWVMAGKVVRRADLAIPLVIAVFSHTVLDLLTHEPDIAIAPHVAAPLLGLGLYRHPWLAFVVEVVFGVLCWRDGRPSGFAVAGRRPRSPHSRSALCRHS